MSNRILLKRSGVANTAPSAANLEQGELAINYADGTLYFKNSSNNIITLASTQSANITGNITAGNIMSLGIVSAAGNVSGANIVSNGVVQSTGNIIAGAVTYAATDGLTGQCLATYGNGVTYWASVGGASGSFKVYYRNGSYITMSVVNGYLTVVGRSGDIKIPV